MIRAEPLTKDAFSPFGDVITTDLTAGGTSANQGTARRFDWIAQFQSTRPDAKANLAVFRSVPKVLPFSVALLERHPCSTQMFVAMRCDRYLVVVAPNGPNGGPDTTGLRAFLCREGQGVNYRAGVWHHPIIAIDQPADFLMLAWEDGSPRDCEEHPLSERISVTE